MCVCVWLCQCMSVCVRACPPISKRVTEAPWSQNLNWNLYHYNVTADICLLGVKLKLGTCTFSKYCNRISPQHSVMRSLSVYSIERVLAIEIHCHGKVACGRADIYRRHLRVCYWNIDIINGTINGTTTLILSLTFLRRYRTDTHTYTCLHTHKHTYACTHTHTHYYYNIYLFSLWYQFFFCLDYHTSFRKV
jgi:hypothetical protein